MFKFKEFVDEDKVLSIIACNIAGYSVCIKHKVHTLSILLTSKDKKEEYYFNINYRVAILIDTSNEDNIREIGHARVEGYDLYDKIDNASIWANALIQEYKNRDKVDLKKTYKEVTYPLKSKKHKLPHFFSFLKRKKNK